MIVGDAAHLYILQPDLVSERYAVSGICAATKRDGKPCEYAGTVEHDGEFYCGTHKPKGIIVSSGRAVITEYESDACVSMRDSVLSHPRARDLIDGPGPLELSIVWRDRETGLLCKGRLDKFNEKVGVIADLKTTTHAGRRQFMRKIYGFGYHIQSGMYLPGAMECGLDARHFIIIPVENTSPFTAAAYRFKDEVVNAGMEESRRLMRIYAQCVESGNWPGYSDEIEDIDLPTWDWKELENGDEQ